MRLSQKRNLALLLFFNLALIVSAQQRCSFDEQWSQKKNQQPTFQFRINAIEDRIQRQIHANTSLDNRTSYQIPVVFHVLWNTDMENFTDEVIATQLDILNQDFTGKNPDISSVPNSFRPLIAAANIEFCLASIDPDGEPTTGITRTRTFVDSLSLNQVYYSSGEGHDAWNTQEYLNIWIANLENNLVGFGSYPGQNNSAEDGVVIDYRVFGINNHPRLNLGRTLTHEVGHYLGLFHPWGSGLFNSDCDEDDQVADTPIQSTTYSGQCPDDLATISESCGTLDMYMNFMNYTNDACLHMFTKGQQLRMLATLLEMRPSLLNAAACPEVSQPNPQKGIVKIGPNPTRGSLYVSSFLNESSTVRIEIYNLKGQIIYLSRQDGLERFFSQIINTSSWSTGTYILNVEIGNQTLVRKILKY